MTGIASLALDFDTSIIELLVIGSIRGQGWTVALLTAVSMRLMVTVESAHDTVGNAGPKFQGRKDNSFIGALL